MIRSLLNTVAQVVINPNDLGVPQGDLGENNVRNILRLAFGMAGAIAVIIVTIAGLKYVMSQGNPQETAKAKNTIIYALVGLAVCMSAFAIVSFFMQEIAT